ncbi:hypothetical protein BC835DRAFT_1411958 [Cytidiella melzeri]|nr:hypothetical protein BC835DRAFT_1411958 [Cytidiella melzeri]
MSFNNSRLTNFLIDDTDSRLEYSGKWFPGGVSEEFQDTTHGTSDPGSNVTFTFNGTFVAAFATIDHSGVRCAYTLDDAEPIAVNQSGSSPPQYKYNLFTLQGLDDRQHQLTITSQGVGQTLWFDYLSYTGQAPPSLLAPIPAATTSSSVSKPISHRISPGVIVAIVLGSVFSLLLLVLLGFFVSRRWHRLRLTRPQHDASWQGKVIEEPELPPKMGFRAVMSMSGLHAPASQGTTILSSSVFSSVIFNGPYTTSSNRSGGGPRSV